jgi:hypothetical protein
MMEIAPDPIEDDLLLGRRWEPPAQVVAKRFL